MDRCSNCGSPLAVQSLGQTWDNACPECGHPVWLKQSDVVICRVKSLTPYGVLVELGEGVQGRVHISELTNSSIKHPDELVQVGDELRAKVLRIDPANRVVGLSCKQVIGVGNR